MKSKLFGKTQMLGKTEGKRRGPQRMKWLDVTTDSMDTNLSRFGEMLRNREVWCAAIHRVTKIQTQHERTTTTTTHTHTHTHT